MLSKKDRLLARNVRHVEEPVKIKERIAKVSELMSALQQTLSMRKISHHKLDVELSGPSWEPALRP